MSILDSIPIFTEPPSKPAELTGNTLPLLHEIRHALHRLVREGVSTALDLRAIPFAPGDEQRLLDHLGVGEVEVRLRALGTSRIRESGYSGIWVVEHRNREGERIAFQIEITEIPSILKAQPEDIEDGLAKLTASLSASSAEQLV